MAAPGVTVWKRSVDPSVAIVYSTCIPSLMIHHTSLLRLAKLSKHASGERRPQSAEPPGAEPHINLGTRLQGKRATIAPLFHGVESTFIIPNDLAPYLLLSTQTHSVVFRTCFCVLDASQAAHRAVFAEGPYVQPTLKTTLSLLSLLPTAKRPLLLRLSRQTTTYTSRNTPLEHELQQALSHVTPDQKTTSGSRCHGSWRRPIPAADIG
jgi:hypothetical protein